MNIIIVSAMTEEHKIVKETMCHLAKHIKEESSQEKEIFQIDRENGESIRVSVICAHGKGAVPMASYVSPIFEKTPPDHAILVGIAAAVDPSAVKLGDVPFSTQIIDYNDISIENGELEARPEGYTPDATMRRAIGHIISTPSIYGRWQRRCKSVIGKILKAKGSYGKHISTITPDLPPQLVMKVSAAGGFLVRDALFRDSLCRSSLPDETRLKLAHPLHPKIVSVEMEAHAFMKAAHENNIPASVIKGISDYGDSGKTNLEKETEGFYRIYACANSVVSAVYGIKNIRVNKKTNKQMPVSELPLEFDSGFPGLSEEITKNISSKNSVDLLVIGMKHSYISKHMQEMCSKTGSVINLLVCTNDNIFETRNNAYERISDTAYHREKIFDYHDNFLVKAKENNINISVRSYSCYPFGLYLRIHPYCAFIPLWNKNISTSSIRDHGIIVNSNSMIGRHLQRNFKYLWENRSQDYSAHIFYRQYIDWLVENKSSAAQTVHVMNKLLKEDGFLLTHESSSWFALILQKLGKNCKKITSNDDYKQFLANLYNMQQKH